MFVLSFRRVAQWDESALKTLSLTLSRRASAERVGNSADAANERQKMKMKEIDLAKSRIMSDGGAGVERMVRMIDCSNRPIDGESERQRKLHAAVARLRRAGKGHLVPVLRLIVRNGSARHLSLEKVSRASYFRHRDELLRFFS